MTTYILYTVTSFESCHSKTVTIIRSQALACESYSERQLSNPLVGIIIDCEQSLRMVMRARKSSQASETAKNKKPRGSWGGSGKGGKGLSPVSLSAISPSPVLPSLDSTD